MHAPMIPVIAIIPDSDSRHLEQERLSEELGIPPSAWLAVVPEEGRKSVIIEQIRRLHSDLKHARSKRIGVLIDLTYKPLVEVQNSLLKLLEEKTESVQFLIEVKSIYDILPTVRSRSLIRNTHALGDREISTLIRNCIDTPGIGSVFSHKPVAKTEDALVMVDDIVIVLSEKLTQYPGTMPEALKEILRLRGLLVSNNLNAQSTVDRCLLIAKKALLVN